MPPPKSTNETPTPGRVIDPADLNKFQLLGRACASCDKGWPRPRVLFGQTPDGTRIFVCDDCPGSPGSYGDHL